MEDFDEEFVKCCLDIIQEVRAIEVVKEAKWIEIEEKQKEKEFELSCLETVIRTGNLSKEGMSETDNIRMKQKPQNIILQFNDLGCISIFLHCFRNGCLI